MPRTLDLLALNVSAPPPDRAKRILEYLWHREEDILVLGEVAPRSGSALIRQVCEAAGYQVIAPTTSGLGVTVVNRRPDSPLAVEPSPLSPRIVCFTTDRLRIAAVYGRASDPVRYSSSAQRAAKREWLAQFADWVDAERPDVLLGDLNIVDPDADAGLPYVLPAEVATYARLLALGYLDAFRAVNPPTVSWVDHSGVGARFDHAFVIPQTLTVRDCILDEESRAGLTDHSALRLSVQW